MVHKCTKIRNNNFQRIKKQQQQPPEIQPGCIRYWKIPGTIWLSGTFTTLTKKKKKKNGKKIKKEKNQGYFCLNFQDRACKFLSLRIFRLVSVRENKIKMQKLPEAPDEKWGEGMVSSKGRV